MLSHLEQQVISYSRTAGGAFGGNIGGDRSGPGQREDTDEYYTYINDPDDNLIELVQHPRGLEDAHGQSVSLTRNVENLRWTQIPGFVDAAYVKTS